MRISDWSSDVCSSDLSGGSTSSPSIPRRARRPSMQAAMVGAAGRGSARHETWEETMKLAGAARTLGWFAPPHGRFYFAFDTHSRSCASTMLKHHSRSYGKYTAWALGRSAKSANSSPGHSVELKKPTHFHG